MRCPHCDEPIGDSNLDTCPFCNKDVRPVSREQLSPLITRVRRHSFVAVSGESFHQAVLQGLSSLFETIGREERDFEATLRPEPDNPHDANAVAVTTENGTLFGYLPRALAQEFGATIRNSAETIKVPAKLTGGDPGRPMIGVVLDFARVYSIDGLYSIGDFEAGPPMVAATSKAKPPPPIPVARQSSGQSQEPPTAAIILMVVGLLGALTKQPALALGGAVLSWVGFALLMKGNGGVVRIGGGFVVALALMALGISCG